MWAWQAKYLFKFDAGEIAQVEKSVVRALDLEPTLKRYYVTLPYDLPAGDTTGEKPTKSAFTKWIEKKAEWEALAADRGMEVEFKYVGAHELASELTRPRHAGRLRYWFNASVLTPESLQRRLDDVIAKAGRRYSPNVHVEVETVQALEGLGRSDRYVQRVQIALAGVRKVRGDRWCAPQGDEAVFKDTLADCIAALTKIEDALHEFLGAVRTTSPVPNICDQLDSVETHLDAVHELLRKRHLKDGRYYHDAAGSLYGQVVKTREVLSEVRALLFSPGTDAAKIGRLLVTGRAGVGKTHLLCDVASRRISAGLPTVVALGQDFDSSKLLPQIGELVQIDGTLEEVLSVLDAAGEASGHTAMLMLDALNESANAERWADDLRVLAGAVERHPYVVLAVSCRSEFVDPVVGAADGWSMVLHRGFAEATGEALDRYTREYNLDKLTFPVLNPEYGNPLFLKLACEALATLGNTRFTLGTAGLTTVCSAFAEAVNKRLAAPARCDYDEASGLVQAAMKQIADLGPGPYMRTDVQQITEGLLPGRRWSESLLLGLLREGVLLDTYDNHVAFGYQRLGDVLRALRLAEQSVESLQAWCASLGDDRWEETGTIGALALIAPEKHDIEIIDLFMDDENRVGQDVVDAFVEGLPMRAPEFTTGRTARLVQRLLEHEWADRVWEKLIQAACIPGHAVNAEWAHQLLLSKRLPERDETWSEWLISSGEHGNENPVGMLLDWGWHPRRATRDTSPLQFDVAHLATLTLGWMLSTPDRRVRDRATRALVSVGERGPSGFAAAVCQFRTCDDPYVVERLAATLCSIALRSTDPAVVRQMADAAVELVADGWPVHLLTRDYLRRTAETAREHGWNGPSRLPPYGAEWPVDAMSLESIETMAKATGFGYSSIWSSLSGLSGDFGRYIVKSTLTNFEHSDQEKLLALALRTIFTRVVDLGWTPERFGRRDSGRRQGRDDGLVERFGKKYQWIGFYEVLGRLADNHELRERWSDSTEPFAYEYAEQLVFRDIDPTVLTPGGMRDPSSEAPAWFMPVQATFPPEVADSYPHDLHGVPDPIDLIALTAPDGTEWLSLIRHSNWTQILPPEIEALKNPKLNVWMQIRSYLVPVDKVDALQEWAAGKDWDGRWMPENSDVHSRLLAAHPGCPSWDWADGNAEPRSFESVDDVPTAMYQPVAWYGGTGTSRESAGTEEPTGYVPSRMLFDALTLGRGADFHWNDADGLAVFDPTAGMEQASTLVMRRDLVGRVEDAGYRLFWTVLLNKQLYDHDYGLVSRYGSDIRWLSASASYLVAGEKVECVSANAWACRPIGDRERKPVEWNISRTG
ncbi:NACHT domain-containing protein [Dietzia alimentaria]|uniref:NACHT domain-containing protein n=1 Tax=Dietzia alimentaria TaxID=665550 RepID=UPI000495039D|nr:hypothetical protein [Dietzia alimentaria]